ncbi:MAG TPA: ribonuclease HII [Pyrinomonadaceae bacterium]|nr:ribonuclease HII [Pyrinomonadaceae bacterium]
MRDAERSEPIIDTESPGRVSLFSDFEITGCGLVFEKQAWESGFKFVAGLDEVGRGCLAGPVVAAACILNPAKELPKGLNDSKQVAAKQRDEIAAELKEISLAYAIGSVSSEEIDRINILEATKLAMRRAIGDIKPGADFLLIDALVLKGVPIPQKSIIKGDSISASIAAASILAKTYRDDLMSSYETEYPEYGFSEHVGYATKRHYAALNAHGPCPIHRMSFRGVLQKTETSLAIDGQLDINI